MKVLMIPELSRFDNMESGVKRVVESYHIYAKDFDIEFVDCPVEDESKYDLMVVHAGSSDRYPVHRPLIAMTHGLYWTADYDAVAWEWKTNAFVIETIRRAQCITVPSEWVAKTIRRDCRVNPVILPHGIEWQDWQHDHQHEGYVLWNKNRPGDVCSTEPVSLLAERNPVVNFLTTFADGREPGNVRVIGVQAHQEMKLLIQKAGVYLSSTKETFGIGTLEAMASGVPVLGFAHGGNLEIVEHGVTGYLAQPGNYDDLATGLDYCLRNRDILSHNSKIAVKKWGWEIPMQILARTFQDTLTQWQDYQRPLRV